MRALWSSASGLSSMQTKIDVIANNVANLDTVGYKAQEAQFAELLTATLSRAGWQAEAPLPQPKDLPLGHGVRVASLATDFAAGPLRDTGQPFDLALEGAGFFAVRNAQGEVFYTRNGHFHKDGAGRLVDDQGFMVLGRDGQPLTLPQTAAAGTVSIREDGTLLVQQGAGQRTVGQVGVFLPTVPGTTNALIDPQGVLQPMGNGYYAARNGQPLLEKNNWTGPGPMGTVRQGFLEGSNVDLNTALSDLIQAQRAYQLNAQAVRTEDQMMSMANSMQG